ncbi:MAG: sulfite exporter TauE/SafE family protein [Planctomycetia bacterium]|nr:sulfite exporter TauE/SafE family protein [Planctomycetia bacterium]
MMESLPAVPGDWSGDVAGWLGLAAASFIAGAVNSVAGGGTIIAFPVLAAILPADPARMVTANATSTVGLWPGAVAAAWAYRGERIAEHTWARHLLGPSVAGAAAGAGLVFLLPAHWFDTLVPWLILGAAVMFAAQPRLATWTAGHGTGRLPAAGAGVAQFLVALYGGYFGAGIGILMLALLGSLGIADIHRANGVKNLLGMAVNGTAALVFATLSLLARAGLAGPAAASVTWGVSWPHVAVMAAAATCGGLAGAHVARRTRPTLVRRFVAIIGFALAGYYLWRQYG